MIFSASAVMAKERFGSAYEFLLKQLVWAVAGLAVMVIAMKVDYKRLQHPALVFTLLGLTTLFSSPSSSSIAPTARTAGSTSDRSRSSHPSSPSPRSSSFWHGSCENKTKAMDDWRNTLLPAVAPTYDLSRADRLPARPRHRHRLRRNHRLHPVRRRHPPALFRIRLCRRASCRSTS